jgi:hypothetical protein
VFDLSIPKLLVPAVLARVIFGPDELPKIASQAAANGALLTPSKSPHSPTDNENGKEPE